MSVTRILTTLLVLIALVGFAVAQTPQLARPEALPADAAPQQVRAEVMAVHDIICRDIGHAAQILTSTGTLAQAIPVVMELTGLEPAEIERIEAEVCRSDVSELSFEELRASNRQAVWLLDVHMAAMNAVLTSP